jgi:Ca2+-transporting ATPase
MALTEASAAPVTQNDGHQHGLTSAEAAASRARSGANRIRGRRGPWLRPYLYAPANPVALVLILIAAIYDLAGDSRDAAVMAVVVVTVVSVETLAAQRAGRAAGALSRLSAPHAMVWRDAELRRLRVEELVVGDVILLLAGSRVPADVRLIEGERLVVDESLLTGEPQPVEHSVAGSDGPILQAGARVLRGRAVATVTAVGSASALGRVAAQVERRARREISLQREVRELTATLLAFAIAFSLVVGVAGLERGQPLRDLLQTELTVAFATLPPELPVLVVMALSLVALSIANSGAILRRPTVIEDLSNVTLMCTDKTGTLTENRVTLTATVTALRALEALDTGARADEAVRRLALMASEPPVGSSELGDPIDLAICRACRAVPPEPVARFGFDSGRRLASAVVHADGSLLLCAKGAPEAVVVRCTRWRAFETVEALDGSLKTQALAAARSLAAGGARVLAVASRELDGLPEGGPSELERDLVFEGLLAFDDTLRVEVPAAVRRLSRAGVTVTMITGDQVARAEAVAAEAGIDGPLFIAAQMRGWGTARWAALCGQGCVIARALPEDKLRAVHAASARGEIVAVTADGVNDLPALHAAQVRVAMGTGGTDAARESADVVLHDNSFATLAEALLESRRALVNLRKVIRYWLSAKVALITLSVAVAVTAHPLPFGPAQIVILEVSMGLCASFSFARLPGPRVGGRRGSAPPTSLLATRRMIGLVGAGFLLAVLVGAGYTLAEPVVGTPGARTLALAWWVVGQSILAVTMAWDGPTFGSRAAATLPMLVWLLTSIAFALVLLTVPAVAARLGGGPVPFRIAVPELAALPLIPLVFSAARVLGRRR